MSGMTSSCSKTNENRMDLPGKRKRAKAKGASGERNELAGENHRDQHEGIQEIAGERRCVPGLDEIVERQRSRDNKASLVGCRMEGRPDGVQQRQGPQRGKRPHRHTVQHHAELGNASTGQVHW